MSKTLTHAHGWYHVEHWRDGQCIWSEDTDNQLYNEGQFALLDIAIRGGTAPANWFIGLMKNTLLTLPAVSSTLASLNTAGPYELTNAADAGYSARAQVNRDATANGWPTLAPNGSGEQITSKTVTFVNTGGGGTWTDTVRWMFVTTVGTVGDTTGKLFSLAQLSADRSLHNGDSLQITYNLRLT
jgi:hypothetical protein